MGRLEDMLPELAGVFAAQESAMEKVVSLLTTQVAHLVQENERHVHHVASLEVTQQQLQDALLTLQQAFDELADQQNAAQKGTSETVTVLQHALDAQQQQLQSVETKSQALDARMEAMGVGPSESKVAEIVDKQFSAVETKMNALLEQRLLEKSNRSYLQTQHTEELMKADLESLEKKFEYLSRVKMDVKELSKKIDKQDQTLDDMRVGMGMLAKSIGTDESDSEGGEDESGDGHDSSRDTRPIRVMTKNDMRDVMKRISQSSADILAKINAASQPEIPVVVDEPPPPSPSRSVSERQAAFAGSRTVGVAPHNRSKDLPEPRLALTSRSECESPEDVVEVSDAPQSPPCATNTSRSSTLNAPGPQEEDSLTTEDISRPLIADARESKVPPEEALEDDAADEESDHVVQSLPPHVAHMQTAPSLSMYYPAVTASTTLVRSRRTSRFLKRQSSVRKEALDSSRSETMRTPMAKDTIKELWRRMFVRLVQLKRLQLINGTSPDRIFRKANISVGAHIKRLEETTTDLEDMVDILEGNTQTNSQSVQALSTAIAQTQLDLTTKVEALEATQTMHGQMIVGIEEKLDLMELDLRRVRNSSNRRESTQSAPNSALTAQHFELAARVHDHIAAFQSIEKIVHQLVEMDLPTLTSRFDITIHDFRNEIEQKSRELAKDLYRSVGRLQEKQDASEMTLSRRMNAFVDRMYRDLLSMTRAHLLSVEMAKSVNATLESSSPQKQKKSSLFDVSLEMLQNVLTHFENDCRSAQGDGETPTLSALLERSTDFKGELEKPKRQSEKRSPLKTLELLLGNPEALHDGDGRTANGENADFTNHIRDLVVQLRSILSLLFLHAELLGPHQKLQAIVSIQSEMSHEIKAHTYALSQLESIEVVVKMMNSRLDSFLEMSITLAKDEDVKKSIQEMLNSSDSVRDNLANQLESTYAEAQKRDEILERELTQLASRVNKKLDKDELLWTQEVLER
ncbi:hypothetical protein FI667_g7311, partial [Globisporangium splendens]